MEENNIVELVRGRMLADKTKASYRSQLSTFSKWLRHEGRDAAVVPPVNDGDEGDAQQDGVHAVLRTNGIAVDPRALTLEDVEKYTSELVYRKDEKGQAKPVGISALSGLRSAVTWSFAVAGVPKPPTFDNDLTNFYKGLKRTDAQIRRESDGGDLARPGKDSLPFSVYRALGLATLLTEDSNLLWAHSFACMSWNLMCRTNNLEALRLARVTWQDDSLQVYFAQLKNDQGGERLRDPTHLYANPISPEICPVLAIGLYLAGGAASEGGLLYPGRRQSQRFSDNLQSALRLPVVAEAMQGEGRVARNIGTHSFRKGAVSFAASGSANGPSFTAVSLRARWTIGSVYEKYIRYERAGDQFCGRVLAGLPLGSPDFAVLPPHFPRGNRVAALAVKSVFPRRLYEQQHLHPVLLHGLASIVFHSEWLLDHLPPKSPLRLVPPLNNRQLLLQLRPLVIIERPGEGSEMVATGIPSHVELLLRSEHQRELTEHMSQRLDGLPSAVEQSLAGLLERRDAEAGDVLPSVFAGMIDRLREEMAEGFRLLLENQQRQADSDQGEEEAASGAAGHMWADSALPHRRRAFPADWKLPSATIVSGWRLWWMGEPDEGVPPYRSLIAHVDIPAGSRQRFNEWKSLFARMEDVLRHLGRFVEEPSSEDLDSMLEVIIKLVKKRSDNKRKRYYEMKVDTVTKKIRGMTGQALVDFASELEQ